MNKEKDVITQDEIKRRKSAKITVLPNMNIFSKNLNNSDKSSSAQLTRSPPLKFKSTSLFAYQELDQFSSFCDNESFPLDILSYVNDNQNLNKNSQNNNTNNQSTQEENEVSDSSESYEDMSEDEIVFKKYKHRIEKRKSAINSLPLNFKNLSSPKPNDILNNNNNFSKSGQKIGQNSIMNNNYLNNNFMLNNSNNNNLRRNSYHINQFQNALFFNNILRENQKSSFNRFVCPQKTIKNNINNAINNNSMINSNNMNNNNSNNNFIQNINNNINNNNSTQLNFNQGFPNNNTFNNYNYMNNFMYNFYNNNNINNNNNNNIKNPTNKKRNSMILLNASEIQEQRRSSCTSIPSIQLINSDKSLKKISKEKEENPNYFLKDQLYCRQIQNKLDKNINNYKYSEDFYNNIKFKLIEIIEHQFGNYVIQKFLSVLLYQENKNLFKMIFLDINDKLFEICIHNYGTRVIQKTLEKLDNKNYYKIETNELNNVFKNLIENHLYQLCCDKNGNHVYQKLLRVFPKERNQFLYDSLIKISLPVSIIQQGATLLQTAFDYSSKQQQDDLCNVIVEKIEELINDKYGNYTIQTVFKLFNDKINDKIFKYIDENLLQLSKEKFSSNVIDKCIIKDYEKSNKLIESIIHKNIIKDIIVDQYGNYVVQKALSISEKEVCIKIIGQIKPILGDLQKTNIGKKIYEKLLQNYKEYLI